ncbi:group II intron reverse transcriptase/maturase, partial [Enterococcus faecium]
YTNSSHMRDKAKKLAVEKLKKKIKSIQKNPTREAVNKYNSTVLGLQNNYSMSTMVNYDFVEIAYIVNKSLLSRTKHIRSKNGTITQTNQKF